LHFLSLNRYLVKHVKVSNFTKENFLKILATTHPEGRSYQSPWLGRIDQIARTKR